MPSILLMFRLPVELGGLQSTVTPAATCCHPYKCREIRHPQPHTVAPQQQPPQIHQLKYTNLENAPICLQQSRTHCLPIGIRSFTRFLTPLHIRPYNDTDGGPPCPPPPHPPRPPFLPPQ